MQVWQAFGGYTQVYGHLPPARKVRRTRLYLEALNDYHNEQIKQAEAEAEK